MPWDAGFVRRSSPAWAVLESGEALKRSGSEPGPPEALPARRVPPGDGPLSWRRLKYDRDVTNDACDDVSAARRAAMGQPFELRGGGYF